MSRNNDSNNIAGIVSGVVLVGGALFGVGYALWEHFSKNSENEHANRRSSQTASRADIRPLNRSSSQVPRQVTREYPRSRAPEEESRALHRRNPEGNQNTRPCPVCLMDLSKERTVTLDCGHEFHKLCLQANFIVHYAGPVYECCVCHKPASGDKIKEFLPENSNS